MDPLKRITVFMQPDIEVVLCSSPPIARPAAFLEPSLVVGIITMTPRQQLVFIGPDGGRKPLQRARSIRPLSFRRKTA